MSKQIVCLMIICCLLCGCSRFNLKASTYYDDQNPIVTMIFDDNQQIVIELYPKVAPNTVNNFISLVQEGYYDGLGFHRIIEDYIIQGGDPLGDNYGNPGYTIAGEFKSNGFKNKLRHEKGVISMARGEKYNSAGSQFFITLQDAGALDGSYAAFGKVIKGMEVIESISSLPKEQKNTSVKTPVIETITVDTKMRKYPDPIVIPINQE